MEITRRGTSGRRLRMKRAVMKPRRPHRTSMPALRWNCCAQFTNCFRSELGKIRCTQSTLVLTEIQTAMRYVRQAVLFLIVGAATPELVASSPPIAEAKYFRSDAGVADSAAALPDN